MSEVTKILVITSENVPVNIEGTALDWSWDDNTLDITDDGDTVALFAPGQWRYIQVRARAVDSLTEDDASASDDAAPHAAVS